MAIVLGLVHLAAFTDRYLIALAAPALKADLRLSDFQIGLLQGSAFVLVFAVAALAFGSVADRSRRTLVIAVSLACWSAANAAFAFCSTFGEMFSARVALGLGQAALSPAALSLIAATAPHGRIGQVVSIYTSGSTLGRSAAFLGGGALMSVLASAPLAFAGDPQAWRALFIVSVIPNFADRRRAGVARACARGRERAKSLPCVARLARPPLAPLRRPYRGGGSGHDGDPGGHGLDGHGAGAPARLRHRTRRRGLRSGRAGRRARRPPDRRRFARRLSPQRRKSGALHGAGLEPDERGAGRLPVLPRRGTNRDRWLARIDLCAGPRHARRLFGRADHDAPRDAWAGERALPVLQHADRVRAGAAPCGPSDRPAVRGRRRPSFAFERDRRRMRDRRRGLRRKTGVAPSAYEKSRTENGLALSDQLRSGTLRQGSNSAALLIRRLSPGGMSTRGSMIFRARR
ncbi:MFS transporter [Chenggangzhangella methanolivorans]|uniref:MFS transporter n=1 Tax=Chenggangzhangella methanolivorans TaxID=1437009 RepID=A0A9E6R8N2_9HYPH|nr:MFS transporter [Chenggangzhangella methanolivorans]